MRGIFLKRLKLSLRGLKGLLVFLFGLNFFVSLALLKDLRLLFTFRSFMTVSYSLLRISFLLRIIFLCKFKVEVHGRSLRAFVGSFNHFVGAGESTDCPLTPKWKQP